MPWRVSMRRAAWSLVLSLALDAIPAAETSPLQDAWERRGATHAAHPLLEALLRAAEESRRDSLARLRAEMSLEPGKTPIRWILDLSGSSSRDDGKPVKPAAEFFEAALTRFADGTIEVVVPARKYLRRPDEARAVVAHEAAHAVLASALEKSDRYQAVPRWFREGIALRFSGEGELRVSETVAVTVFKERGASSFLVGISFDRRPGDATSAAESYLAVRWVERRLGREGLAKLCREVAGGKGLRDELEGLLGLSEAGLRAEALRFARDAVARILPASREKAFRDSLSAQANGNKELAMAAWRRLLEENPQGPLAGTIHYLLAKELLKAPGGAGESGEAMRHLESISRASSVLWRPEALVLLGERLREAGRSSDARALWTEVLEAFGEDLEPASRARKLLEEK